MVIFQITIDLVTNPGFVRVVPDDVLNIHTYTFVLKVKVAGAASEDWLISGTRTLEVGCGDTTVVNFNSPS